ncbi:M13 family metallopeptidase [Nocardia sp. 2]|uniref:M13 family metallopeptidase n=1 Tax=Nocardia acididurans TaxID=2802282 RepID=A0ABS1M4Z6_9NOCA|nr:M13 family metallopeptidase [Nocardia acididurans]MBL1075250.1 M13 family metallopeptidase [Nocardia acididurans]
MTASGPSRLDRRGFLIALGLVPAALALGACSDDPAPKVLKGPDMSGADLAVRPQDDLYRHVNGAWLRDYKLPPDRVAYGVGAEVADRIRDQLKAIIEGIHDPEPGTEAQQIRDFYDAWLDMDGIERLGMTPLADLLAKPDKAATKAELARVMGELPIGGLIGLGVTVDSKKSDSHIGYVGQSGIGLSEDYYRKPEYAEIRTEYRTYLEQIATGAGLADPAGVAQRVFDLETRIAANHWDNVRLRDAEAGYNKLRWAEMTALGPEFDWDPWLAGGTDRPKDLFAELIVGQPSYVTAAAKLWAEVDIAVWREYLKIAVIREYATYLPRTLSDPHFRFFATVLNGQQERAERWKSGISQVNGLLGEPLGKLYVAQHFPESSKQQVQAMVDDLMAAYRADFRASSWMSPATVDAALQKLDKMSVKIGYPDKWEDYSGLKITRGRLVESLLAANVFGVRKMFARLGTPVDKSEWNSTPQTVNAFYSPTNNEITFPAGYLQPPYFGPDASAAVNYGAVGATIGHEIGHGFDDQGSKYDADGNLKEWWTAEDRAAFEAKSARLVEQFDALVPEGLDPSQHVDGSLTLGENLADLRGLQIALAAYRDSEKRSGNDNPDYRALFLSHAVSWRSTMTKELLINSLTDSHAPDEFRCNQIVRNIPEFHSTFEVKDGDKLYLAPDQRVSL